LISNRDAMFHSTELENLSCLQQVPTECRLRVTSVVLSNGRLPVSFRYAPLATEIARHCNMSRRAGHFRPIQR
jgi:hypothetical protein